MKQFLKKQKKNAKYVRSRSHDWYPWITPLLKEKEFEVDVLQMPNSALPTINNWVGHLQNTIKDTDENTYFIGHSVGCQAILRFFEKLAEKKKKVGGALFVAGWFGVDNVWDSLKPWVDSPINFEAVKAVSSNFRTLLSENDPFTSKFNENAALWKERIGAVVTIVKDGKHFNGSKEPAVLEEIEKLVQ